MPSTLNLDAGFMGLLIVFALGVLGFSRGVRAEGVTLAGVLGSAVVFTSEAMREGIIAAINRVPPALEVLIGREGSVAAAGAGRLLKAPDDKLLFAVAFFLVGVILFYFAGSILGGGAVDLVHRLGGGILGALNGFVVGTTMSGFLRTYFSLHPNLPPVRLQPPAFLSPTTPESSNLLVHAPWVFVVAFLAIGILVAVSLRVGRGA
ncbi:MAG: hypothetical protein HYU86_02810 [Chloroflexi bacterium]|nr:hypothetical protein [Chloroflexota bacterium]